MDLVYLIGPPGVGKSSVMLEMTRSFERLAVRTRPAHDVLFRGTLVVGAELGARREKFSGTDALPMNVQHDAEEWIRGTPYKLILGEGQRLANMNFFSCARDAGYDVTVIALEADEDMLAARRRLRGSSQNETWVKAATTRARNLAELTQQAEFSVLRLNLPQATPSEVASYAVANVPALSSHGC